MFGFDKIIKWRDGKGQTVAAVLLVRCRLVARTREREYIAPTGSGLGRI